MFHRIFQKYRKKNIDIKNMDVDSIIKNMLKHDVHFHFSKSGGHGWQKINKKKTKAELYFNLWDSEYLTDEQKELFIKKAWHAMHHHERILIMTCQEERYQRANKDKVIHLFVSLLKEVI